MERVKGSITVRYINDFNGLRTPLSEFVTRKVRNLLHKTSATMPLSF